MSKRDFAFEYTKLLAGILTDGRTEWNHRTGAGIEVARGARFFQLDLSDGALPTCGLRRTWPRSAAAEVAWQVSGVRDIQWLKKYCGMWSKFADSSGQVPAAYGHRWRRHFGRDQLHMAVEALHADPTDRQVVVVTWDASRDGLGSRVAHNVPCTTHFTLSMLGGELHTSLFVRSSDVFMGLPYDLMGHALLTRAIGQELGGVSLGTMSVTLAHAHLYEAHSAMAREAVRQTPVLPGIRMPDHTLTEIELDPDEYVRHVAELAKAEKWPDYNPTPEVIV